MSDTPSFLPLTGHAKDLGGGFTVRRLLPAVQRKAVGPFLFFDHFGPVTVCLLYTSPSPRDQRGSRMPSSA